MGGGVLAKTSSKKPPRLELISFKKLSKGALLLGVVTRAHRDSLVIALPSSLSGVVRRPDSSDLEHAKAARDGMDVDDEEVRSEDAPLSDIFPVGHVVRCVVLGLQRSDGAKRIDLSLRASLINKGQGMELLREGMHIWGAVSSIEDHGYVVDIGIEGIRAFLNRRDADSSMPALKVGQPVEALVKHVNHVARTAQLMTSQTKVTTAITNGVNFNLRSLKPGMLIKGVAHKILQNGVLVSFMDFFAGGLDHNHMSTVSSDESTGWKAGIKPGDEVTARILHVDYAGKAIRLTQRPHLMALAPVQGMPDSGAVVEGAEVVRVDSGIGLLLQLPGDKGVGAYVHISRISDDRIENVEKAYEPGKLVTCRVVGTSPVEGWAAASLKPTVLAASLLSYSDVSVGQVLKGEVTAVEGYGALVSLGAGVRGIVTTMHLSDVAIKKPKNRFKIGAKVTCRVLSAQPEQRKVQLTLKKSLVKDESPILSAFDEAKRGQAATGFVTKIGSYGIVVTFYSNVHGLIPAKALANQGVEDPSESFMLGQVVRCVVLKCDSKVTPPKLLLSLDISGALLSPEEEADEKTLEQPSPVKLGTLVDGTVSGSDEKNLYVKIPKCSWRCVLPKDVSHGKRARGQEGKMSLLTKRHHAVHLCDNASFADGIAESYPTGTKVKGCVVLEASNKQRQITLTLKPLLLAAHAGDGSGSGATLPSDTSALAPGDEVVGWISKVNDFGVFVRFIAGVSALCPRALLADQFVKDARSLFTEGDSMRCVVQHVDHTAGKSVITCKRAAVPGYSGSFLPTLLAEGLSAARAGLPAEGGRARQPLPDLTSYGIGSTCNASVTAVKEYGTVLTGADGTLMLCSPQSSQSNLATGDVVKVRILDVDAEKGVLEVTMQPDLVKAGRSKRRRSVVLPAEGATVNIEIVHCRDDAPYAIGVVQGSAGGTGTGSLALVQLADYHCPYRTAADEGMEVGDTVKAVVAASSLEGEYTGTSLVVPADWVAHRRRPTLSHGQSLASTAQVKPIRISKLEEGTLVQTVVRNVAADQLQVGVSVKGGHAKCRVHVSEAIAPAVTAPAMTDAKAQGKVKGGADGGELPPWHPFAEVAVGSVIEAVVMSIKSKGDFKVCDLSTNPKVLEAARGVTTPKKSGKSKTKAVKRPEWDREGCVPQVGDLLCGVITQTISTGCWAAMSGHVRGFIPLLELSHDIDVLKHHQDYFKTGMGVKVLVVGVDEGSHHLDLSAASSGLKDDLPARLGASAATKGLDGEPQEPDLKHLVPLASHSGIKAGSLIAGRINAKRTAFRPPAITVDVGAKRSGRVCVTEASDPEMWKSWTDKSMEDGSVVECRVLRTAEGKLDLSLRPSRLDPALSVAKAIASDPAPQEDTVVRGFVVSTSKVGCFVRLSREVTARVLLKDLAEGYVTDPVKDFPPGMLVAGRVLPQTRKDGMLLLSLKPSVVVRGDHVATYSNIKKGMKVRGTVKQVQSYGVFVQLEDSEIRAMCHKSEAADHPIQDLTKEYEEGDYVKAVVLKVDADKKRVSLGLKPSYFDGDESSSQEESGDEEGVELSDEEEAGLVPVEESEEEDSDGGSGSDSEGGQGLAARVEGMDVEKEEEEEESSSDEEEESGSEKEEDEGLSMGGVFGSVVAGGATEADVGFEFDGFTHAKHVHSDNSEPSDSETEGHSKGRKTRQKAAEKRAHEEQLRVREKELLDGDNPQSANDFERLLMGEPNSSYLWMKYMAFQLSLADVDAARTVGHRALRKIIFREEQERLNMWVALLNLEHQYGTPAELQKTFESACESSHPKRVHLKMCELHERADEPKEAEAAYAKAAKRFKGSKKVWMSWQKFRLHQGDEAGAQELLQRSLQSLSRHKHVEVTSKFAHELYVTGHIDSGRTIYEGLLAAFPKRLDLWNVYIDREISTGQTREARALLERQTTLQLNAKKMKGVFKRFLRFEMKHGDAESEEAVKAKARAYVESLN
ncbi:unnamed protein product [Chrysoparadoxa australica]